MKKHSNGKERIIRISQGMIDDLNDFYGINAVTRLRQIDKEASELENSSLKCVFVLVDKSGIEKRLSETELNKLEEKINFAKPNKKRVAKLVKELERKNNA